MDVRINSPKKAYQAPMPSVPVAVEIDAPEGSFNKDDGASYVAVGLDGDRDGEFRNESPVRLHSDRHVEVWAKSFAPDGTLKLHTRVGDFKGDFMLDVPVSGSHNVADLRALLVTPLGEKASEPLPIVLDAQGPRIHAELSPVDLEGKIESGVELEVRVFADPPDLSGLAMVEAKFETPAIRGEEPKWEVAKRRDDAIWVARLKTKDLLGPQTVLTRAEDNVGNKSEGRPQMVVIVRPQVAAATSEGSANPDVTNSVSGQVVYVNRGVSAEVTLETPAGTQIGPQMAGADGRFKFSKVPPGIYDLKAKSTVPHGGYRREAKIRVTVHPRPEPATLLPPLNLN
jgi:hypothetical protein